MNALQSFLERGPERRAALENALVYYIPPELRGWLGLAEEINPVVSMERAGSSARAVADPNVKGWDKVAAVGDTASNMANAVAPVVLGSSGAVPAANAVEEALMGWSASSPMAYAVRDFVTDEFGGVGFRAYHGSPHDFDRFSLDKIGTGEGAQAYGHGLYFADSEDVARSYRDALSGNLYDTGYWNIDMMLNSPGAPSWDAFKARYPDQPTLQEMFADIEARGAHKPVGIDGRMYEVQINADPNDFLDWDKPLSEQPAAVRPMLEKWAGALGLDPQTAPFNRVGGLTKSPEGAQALSDAGIPGIRYLDAGSRGAGDGSRNYVVFDDKLIDIIRKYGWAAAAPMLATYGISEAEAREMRPDLAQEDKNALSGFLAERGL